MLKKIKVESMEEEGEELKYETSQMKIMQGAKVEDNVMVPDDKSYYSDWR